MKEGALKAAITAAGMPPIVKNVEARAKVLHATQEEAPAAVRVFPAGCLIDHQVFITPLSQSVIFGGEGLLLLDL